MEMERQRRDLERMAGSMLVVRLPPAIAALALVSCAVGWWCGTPPGWMVGVFLGVVWLAARQTVPHIVRAGRALGAGRRADVIVMSERNSDSESNAWIATVYAAPGMTWQFDFIPLGWHPVVGTARTEARFVSDASWPALLVFADGLAWPRANPRRVEGRAARAPHGVPVP